MEDGRKIGAAERDDRGVVVQVAAALRLLVPPLEQRRDGDRQVRLLFADLRPLLERLLEPELQLRQPRASTAWRRLAAR